MKKVSIIILALMVLVFAHCKKEKIENTSNKMVKIQCAIDLNNGGKSDFSNLFDDGSITWSEGTERIYVTQEGKNTSYHNIVELTATITPGQSKAVFTGEVPASFIDNTKNYDVWYFGNSHQNAETTKHTYTIDYINAKIIGDLTKQSGTLAGLGNYHIAMTTAQFTDVSFNSNNVLSINGELEHQIAILLLDLNGVEKLYSDAGHGYELIFGGGSYNNQFLFHQYLNAETNIEVSGKEQNGLSYVVLLASSTRTKISCHKNGKIYSYIFPDGLQAGKVYYTNTYENPQAMPWIYEGEVEVEYESVDLGLPSGTQWATFNVGANKPSDFGGYYAWGEITTKDDYGNNYVGPGDDVKDITGNPLYDAATANWGEDWCMPTKAQCEELLSGCTYVIELLDGVLGHRFTSITNGNSIFIPNANYMMGTELWGGDLLAVRSSQRGKTYPYGLFYLKMEPIFNYPLKVAEYSFLGKGNGCSVRPVRAAKK